MSSDRRRSDSGLHAARILTLAILLSRGADPAHAGSYSWNNPAGGSAANGANWTPNAVPGALDDATFGVFGNYGVTWSSPADTLQSLTVINSQPSFTITGRLGVRSHPTLENNSWLAVFGGQIAGPSWSMVENGSDATLTFTGPTSVGLAVAPSTTSLFGSRGGNAALVINNGATFTSAGEISFAPNLTAMTTQIGQAGGARSVLATTTSGIPGRGWIAVGDYGQATLGLDIGGKLNPAGDLFVGRHPGASGQVQLQNHPGQVPLVDARAQVFVGANDEAGTAGGTGFVDVQLGTFSSLGRCWLGDPDDPPLADATAPTARLLVEGGSAVLAGGLTVGGSGRFEPRAGNTHVIGGTVVVHSATPFEIGTSTGNNPTLYLENGATADLFAPDTTRPALGVGRGGKGTLNVTRTGTTLTVHGALVMSDSVGANGLVNVDSAATVVVTGKTRLGGAGPSQLRVQGVGTTLTLQDSTLLGIGGSQQAVVFATHSATVHLQKAAAIGVASYGDVYCNDGAQLDVAGCTLGPSNGGMFVGFSGAAVTVSGHLDLVGNGFLEVDSGGSLFYTGSPVMNVGAGSPQFIVSDGSLAHLDSELDVRGLLYMEPSQTSGLTSGNPVARVTRPATPLDAFGLGGRLECPLVRVFDSGRAIAVGTIAGRFHLDSGTATLRVSYDNAFSTGHLIVGDSTRTDGFVSVGTTSIGLDTLRVLDSDGGDLGKMTIAGGRLELPKPGKVGAGTILSGYGTVAGSLIVADSGWVSLHGQITGDLALAGTLDLGPAVSAIVMGSYHPTAIGRTTCRFGHANGDLFVTNGALVAGGTLDLKPVSGDTPQVGDTLTVMLGTVSGTFANVTFDGHPAAGIARVLYRPGDVRVAMIGAVTGVDDGGAAAAGPPPALRFAAVGEPRDAALALELPIAMHARIALFDVDGRRRATVADAELGAGRHRFALARQLPSGCYFARAELRGAGDPRALVARVVVLR